MRCAVCGAESGRYPLCRSCHAKAQTGEIIKCPRCQRWHYAKDPCPVDPETAFLYEPRPALVSAGEEKFWEVMKTVLPQGYCIFPQINLAAFINRTDDARFHNELFRNVDFLITDSRYRPRIVVEINDQSHLSSDRRERDTKVRNICEEAGIPFVVFWNACGADPAYIGKRLEEALTAEPQRIRHVPEPSKTPAAEAQVPAVTEAQPPAPVQEKKKGCYIATCVYGSYDCPEVWMLRRFRDFTLERSLPGRMFIRCYYAVSPGLVRMFGGCGWFRRMASVPIGMLVRRLRRKGCADTPYQDL